MKAEIRGAREIRQLWERLPVAMARWSAGMLPEGIGLLDIGNRLRAAAWREKCASGNPVPCVDLALGCAHVGAGTCPADCLFPMHVGGGAPQWRTATLLVQLRPGAGELRLLALGEVAVEQLPWAIQTVARRFGLPPVPVSTAGSLPKLVPDGARTWRLDLVTPWLTGKTRPGGDTSFPDGSLKAVVKEKLKESLSARAHKVSALATADPLGQRLGGHLARYVTEAVVDGRMIVREIQLETVKIEAASLGRDKNFDVHAWTGHLALEVGADAEAWMSLVEAFGLGENGDKGFGQVELVGS